MEMMTRTLPSSSSRTYINDQVQVSNDLFALSKNSKQNHSVVQISNYLQALRSAFIHLQVESNRVVEGVSGLATSTRVSSAGKKMQQLMQSKAECDNTSAELLTWTAILRLRDFLKNSVSEQLSLSGPANTPCGIWLSPSAKSHIQACLASVEEELMRALPSTMNASELQRVQSIFNSVLKFELTLLDSAHSRRQKGLSEPPLSSDPWDPSNIIFATDFDVTCTVVDSCEALVGAAEAAAIKSVEDIEPGKLRTEYEAILDRHSQRTRKALCSLDNKEPANESVKGRLSGRDENSADLVPGMDPSLKPLYDSTAKTSLFAPDESFTDFQFDQAGLRGALSELSDLEVLCNQDAMSSGVLGGASKEDIKAEARHVAIRENCPRVLRQLVEIGTNIHVVSANWSRDLIIGALPELPKEQVFLHCNDLSFDISGVSTGLFDMTVVDAFDKEQMLRALRKIYNFDEAETVQKERKVGKMMVFMGDSYTDLLGLLEADLGIVIGQSADLRTVMSHYGIQLLPLSRAAADISMARVNESECSWRHSGVLFEAQGWDDVEACLFGYASSTAASFVSSAEPAKSTENWPEEQSVQQQLHLNTNSISQERLPAVNLELLQVAC